ncbi:nucleotide exchange factor GrpE [endosymbiont of Sipalinus gigas]|uniref:nucleotide exchange factor GrpE n=1 Tax=endosymbiont of Sipalinus gigas TaxID=1972134 RepID=UPI00102E29EF|nr:nucleotide exchange factor GrpE [endosymbiont of Sipalinus gigas]
MINDLYKTNKNNLEEENKNNLEEENKNNLEEENKNNLEEENKNNLEEENKNNLEEENKNNFYNINEILKLKENIENLNNKLINNNLYFKAEIENIKKRHSIEIDKIRKLSLEKFMLDLIPIIDNLERTLEHKDSKIENIIEGVELTLKLLIKVINNFGLFSIDKINVPFDHNIHQAVVLEFSDKYKDNYITEILEKGYILNDKLIKPAMVKVSTNKK